MVNSSFNVLYASAESIFSGKLILHKRAASHHRITVIAYINSAGNDIKKRGFVDGKKEG